MARTSRRRDRGMGSIFQLKDGRWRSSIQAKGVDGRVRPWTFTAETKAEVTREHKRRLLHLESGKSRNQADNLAMGRFIDEWITKQIEPEKSPSTTRSYRYLHRLYIDPVIGGIRLPNLTTHDVQRVLDACRKAGKSATTAQRAHATLRSSLTYARRMGYVSTNVARDVRAPSPKKAEPIFLDPSQAKLLLGACEGSPIEGPLKLALATGMRLGEVLGLRWEDVSEDAGTISVRVQLRRFNGEFRLAPLKTKSSRRTVPITGVVQDALRVARMHSGTANAVARHLDLVFIGQLGGPVHQKVFNENLKELCEKAGVPVLSAHKLRHTAASLMIAKGVPLAMVKNQLGHSTITLTADTYGHMVPAAQRVAATALDEVLSSGSLNPKK